MCTEAMVVTDPNIFLKQISLAPAIFHIPESLHISFALSPSPHTVGNANHASILILHALFFILIPL